MPTLSSIVIHCSDPYIAGPFWSLALSLPPVDEDAEKLRDRTLEHGESVLLRDPAQQKPDVWISPHTDLGRGAIHLDLQLGSMAELDVLIEAGAVRRWEVYEPHRWTVLEAPDGVLFCAIHPRPANTANL